MVKIFISSKRSKSRLLRAVILWYHQIILSLHQPKTYLPQISHVKQILLHFGYKSTMRWKIVRKGKLIFYFVPCLVFSLFL
uniref:Uncharacterized protein n=1 Tax=Octopus bimaculoides TaxID=37653 RepID=A0A0L8GLS9_OCTBM